MYSMDLRERVVRAYEEGSESMRNIAKRFKVSLSFVNQIWQRYKSEKTLESKAHGGGKAYRVEGESEVSFLRGLVEEKNDRTLEELRGLFEQKFGKSMSLSTVHETLKRLNLSRKKKVFTIQNAKVKPSPKEPCFIGKKS